MKITFGNHHKWLMGLTLLAIIAPFLLLKIGPKGYEYYGPDVPDVYILGGYIFGKDLSWEPIKLAFQFQLLMILLYLLLIVISYLTFKWGVITRLPLMVSLLLLLLFPFWLALYTQGVMNNSDGADLTVYPHVGVIIYGLGFCLNYSLIVKMKKYRLSLKPSS
jgi:hypothetical protein